MSVSMENNPLELGRPVTSKRKFKDLLLQKDNQFCADCNAAQPKWASANIGVFLCFKCYNVHRSLDDHISRVLPLGDEWSDDDIDAMVEVGGNSSANSIYEAYIPEGYAKPSPDASQEERTKFIRAKYEYQEFLKPSLRIVSSKSSHQSSFSKNHADSLGTSNESSSSEHDADSIRTSNESNESSFSERDADGIQTSNESSFSKHDADSCETSNERDADSIQTSNESSFSKRDADNCQTSNEPSFSKRDAHSFRASNGSSFSKRDAHSFRASNESSFSKRDADSLQTSNEASFSKREAHSFRSTHADSFRSSNESNFSQSDADSFRSATSLKNLERTGEFIGKLLVRVIRGTNLAIRDMMTSDPYVVLKLGKQTVKTSVINSNLNPVWNQVLILSVPTDFGPLGLKVFDQDMFSSDDIMGEAEVDLQPLIASAMAFGDAGMFEEDMQIGKWLKTNDNALKEDSTVNIIDGRVKQKISLVLQNVECGEIDLEIEWIPL